MKEWSGSGWVKPEYGRVLDWSQPLSRNLIGLWLLNENTGNTVNDLTGVSGSLPLTNSPSWSPTVMGTALRNDKGQTSPCGAYGAVSESPLLTNQISIMWIGMITNSASGPGIAYYLNANNYMVIKQSGATTLQAAVTIASSSSSTSQINASVSAPINCIATYDGANLRLYIGGALKASVAKAGSFVSSSRSASIGRNNSSTNGPGVSVMGAVWNRALTAYDIASLNAAPYAMALQSSQRRWWGIPASAAIGGFSGSGEFGASGVEVSLKAGGFSGGGALNAVSLAIVNETAVFSGAGQLASAAQAIVSAGAGMNGAGILNENGLVMNLATAGWIANGLLGAAPGGASVGNAAEIGVGVLSANGQITPIGTANLSGSGSLYSSSQIVAMAAAGLSGSGSLSAGGAILQFGAAQMRGTGQLSSIQLSAIPLFVVSAGESGDTISNFGDGNDNVIQTGGGTG